MCSWPPAPTSAWKSPTTAAASSPRCCRAIFEPFFTTKRSPHRGLGLAWVYGIVTNHGGGVAISSQPDAGTSVRLYLPAERRAVMRVRPAGRRPQRQWPDHPDRGRRRPAADHGPSHSFDLWLPGAHGQQRTESAGPTGQPPARRGHGHHRSGDAGHEWPATH